MKKAKQIITVFLLGKERQLFYPPLGTWYSPLAPPQRDQLLQSGSAAWACRLPSHATHPLPVGGELPTGFIKLALTLESPPPLPHSPLSYHHLFFNLSKRPCSFSFNTARFTGFLEDNIKWQILGDTLWDMYTDWLYGGGDYGNTD